MSLSAPINQGFSAKIAVVSISSLLYTKIVFAHLGHLDVGGNSYLESNPMFTYQGQKVKGQRSRSFVRSFTSAHILVLILTSQ